eukprot:3444217-Pleurochrysis_carterae.AAC.1
MSRAWTSASISGLDRVKVRQSSAAFVVALARPVADDPTPGAQACLTAAGLTRVSRLAPEGLTRVYGSR